MYIPDPGAATAPIALRTSSEAFSSPPLLLPLLAVTISDPPFIFQAAEEHAAANRATPERQTQCVQQPRTATDVPSRHGSD